MRTTEKCFLCFNDVNGLTEGERGGGNEGTNSYVGVYETCCVLFAAGVGVLTSMFFQAWIQAASKKEETKQNNHNRLKCENVSNGDPVMCCSAGFAPTLNSITSAPEADIAEQLLYDSSDSGS